MRSAEYAEGYAITKRMMEQLMSFSIKPDPGGATLRASIGQLLGNFSLLIDHRQVGTQLLTCFNNALVAGATWRSMDNVRVSAVSEDPKYPFGVYLVNAGMTMSLSSQCQIITTMAFTSRSQVDALMDEMSIIVDDIKLRGSELFEVQDYRNVVALSALLIQHLSATERLLPRIVSYNLRESLPALTVSQKIYFEGSRSDELIAENGTIHPAFMRPEIIALSS